MNNLRQLIDKLHNGNRHLWEKHWFEWLAGKANKLPVVIFTPNPEQVVQAQQNPAFFTLLLWADVLLADGVGLVIASRLLNQKSIKRLTGREVLEWWLQKASKLANNPKLASKQAITTLLLGAKPGSAEALARQYDPDIGWCLASAGYQNVAQPTEEEEKNLKSLLQTVKPQIIFVAFGAPWQETWVSRWHDFLAEMGVKIVMVCGGGVDVLSPATSLRPPPPLLTKLHLEWLYRLWQEPWRWRRQLRLLKFIWLVIITKFSTNKMTNKPKQKISSDK